MSERTKAEQDDRRLMLTGGALQSLASDVPVWIVTGGSVDVFIEHERGRLFVLSASAGDRLFGLPEDSELQLSVTGAEGTSLQGSTLAESGLADLAKAADDWVHGLARCFDDRTADRFAPLLLSPGERFSPESGAVLRAAKDPLWAVIPAVGRVQIVGTDTIVQGPAALPVTGALRLRLLERSAVWTESSVSLARPEVLAERLLAFNRLLPALLRDLDQGRSAAALTGLHSAQVDSDKRLRSSLETLTRSTQSPDSGPLYSGASLGPVGAALARVFEVLRHEADHKRLADPSTELADVPGIARRAGVRSRRVLLRPGWHREDLGPLVSTHGESRAVVSLIPASGRGYHLFDPESGQTRPLSDDEVATVGPTAYSLYRPLGETPQRVRDLIRFVWRDVRRDGVTAILAGAAVGLLATAVPIMTAVVIDTVIPSSESLLLIQLGIALGLVAILSFAFSVSREVALHRINGRTGAALQVALWDRLLRLPSGFFRGYSAGDLAQRVAGIEAVRTAIVDVALGASLAFVFSSFNIVLLFFYSPMLAGIAAALVLVLAVITFGAGLLQIRYGRTIAAADGELSGMLFQLLQGVTKLRVAGAESRALARWADRYAEERSARFKAGRISNHYEAFSGSYQLLTLAILFGAAGWLTLDKLSAGVFIAFLAAFGAFQSAFLQFARAALSIFAVMPLYERGKPILSAPLEIDSSKVDPGSLRGAIKIGGLVFAYGGDGAPIFNGLDLTIEAGQSVALVGASGSGKSTLLRLLLGFERPSAGAILYDGHDLQGLDLALLRRQVGVVLQSSRVFAGSILENIRGAADLSIEACLEAAHAAGLESDLALMPMGLHTPLTEGAGTLSGGQRQRILIARALAGKPKVLFFDEATSALDNKTQAIVTATLERLGVTRIIIAHRLSTVRNADKICVVDQGRIKEQGSFDELMAAKGQFAALATRQLL